MSHEHSEHSHSHTPKSFGMAFAIATVLNIAIVLLQVVFGFIAHSTALLADGAHNTGDVIGLIMAWGAYMLAQKQPTSRFTYGLRSSTVLAALFNGLILMVATGAIVWEAIQRLITPTPIEGGIVMAIAGIAILFNGFSAWLLSRGGGEDVNIKSAFWHLASDAAVSAGVVVAAFLITKTGAFWLDPLASIVISIVIVWSTWGLFREAMRLSLQAVPASIDPQAVQGYLQSISGVMKIHDLHIWPISTTETALTAHFMIDRGFDANQISNISHELEHKFNIGHTTIQLENADGSPCALASEKTV